MSINYPFIIFSGIGGLISIIILISHIYVRCERLIYAMKESVHGSSKWCKCENIVNHYFSCYDHLITYSCIIMITINTSIIVLLLILSVLQISSIYHCSLFIYIIHSLFILSRIFQYIYTTLLTRIITNETSFESKTKKSLRIIWFYLFIALIISTYLAFEEEPFDNNFGINESLINTNNKDINDKCKWDPLIPFRIFSAISDVCVSVILIWLLITPLRTSANMVHQRLTSLREDPLHQAMWKYLLLMTFIVSSSVLLSIAGCFGFGTIFAYVLVISTNIANFSTHLLFVETVNLISCCFKCLNIIEYIMNKCCCCCCGSIKEYIKDENSFNAAAKQYSIDVSSNKDNNIENNDSNTTKNTHSNAITNTNTIDLVVDDDDDNHSQVPMLNDKSSHSKTKTKTKTINLKPDDQQQIHDNYGHIITPRTPMKIPLSTRRHKKSTKSMTQTEIHHFFSKSMTIIPSFHKNHSVTGAGKSVESHTTTQITMSTPKNEDLNVNNIELDPISLEHKRSIRATMPLNNDKSGTVVKRQYSESQGYITDEDKDIAKMQQHQQQQQQHQQQRNSFLKHITSDTDDDENDIQMRRRGSSKSSKAEHFVKLSQQNFTQLHQKTVSQTDQKMDNYILKHRVSIPKNEAEIDKNKTITTKDKGNNHELRYPSDYNKIDTGNLSDNDTMIEKTSTMIEKESTVIENNNSKEDGLHISKDYYED